jgi:LCP family protein required for cell wall assembly
MKKDGSILNSIVVEKATGVVNIVEPDGTNAENLLFFDPEFKKKTLEIPDVIPNFGDELVSDDNSFNILIAGKHGSLVDTMIFAHVDEERGDVRMISIPRDLFYNGRKINSFAFYYGMPELKKVLSDITGYELDKYILIDMYAFIDVIDLIGGVDIHLDKAVIDPTYRTVDNGVEGTLHYEPGDYHLGGVEALRLARTRHTSSDFARAERQQMIIESIQDKARNFGFGDADTLYEIAKVVLAKTETDISLDEALTYYFRYQNYNIVSNNVMSSGNVLYVPPYITDSDCQKMIAQAAAAGKPNPGCTGMNNAYTLLPRNDNWDVIKWYFRENFEDVSKAGNS